MKVLVADKFEQSGLDALKAAGCDVVFQPDASGDALVTAIKQSQAAGHRRPIDASHRGDDGRRRAVADRAGRGGRQYHRRRGGVEARHLRLELPGPEFCRGGRADDGFDPRARSAACGQRRGAACRHLEQEGIFEGEGADGTDPRPARLRPHRPRGREACARVRHAGDRLEPAFHRRRSAFARPPNRNSTSRSSIPPKR